VALARGGGSAWAKSRRMTDLLPAGGDDEAFDAVVTAHHTRVYNVALRCLGDPDEAADVTQETFINAYRSFRRFRGDSAVYTWLYRITINNCRNRLRQRRRSREVMSEPFDDDIHGSDGDRRAVIADAGPSPQAMLEDAEFRDKVAAAVQSLEPEYREVIVLREFEDLSYNEIAQVTGISLDLVRTRLSRARAMLRRKLEAYYRNL
jgi:RNA polymerase sigma-70 factor, ECF subfamily